MGLYAYFLPPSSLRSIAFGLFLLTKIGLYAYFLPPSSLRSIAFGLFLRPHHCRCCGKLVCQKCSPNKMSLLQGKNPLKDPPKNSLKNTPKNLKPNSLKTKPQRVCSLCENAGGHGLGGLGGFGGLGGRQRTLSLATALVTARRPVNADTLTPLRPR